MCSRAETLAMSWLVTAVGARPRVGGGRWWCGRWWREDTLLGPEKTTHRPGLWGVPRGSGGGVGFFRWPAGLVDGPDRALPPGVGVSRVRGLAVGRLGGVC